MSDAIPTPPEAHSGSRTRTRPEPLRLQVTSDPANLAPVRRDIERFAAAAGLDEVACGEVGLCINEAMANVIRHAYDGATDRPVVVEARVADDAVVVTLRDWGNGGEPPTVVPQHDPLTPGGLGLLCLQAMMQDIAYRRQPDGMLLTMKRKLP